MADWDTPPTAAELAGAKDPWATPPTPEELGVHPKPSALEAAGRGAMRGIGDRMAAGIDAAGKQYAIPQPGSTQLRNVQTGEPADLTQLGTDKAQLLAERRARGAEAEAAHPKAFLAGEMVPAVASMAIPGTGGIRGAAAISGALTAAGSETDDPARLAAETATGAALGGAGAKILSLLGRGAGSAGARLLPRAEAIRDALMARIGDRSAAAAEALNRAAQGTAGASRANASRTVERLGMEAALPQAEVSANRAALATPEAQQLASELAGRARTELPVKLAHMQGTQALAQQTAADAAAARSPEAVAAMEQQMRGEIVKRLLLRYAVPAGAGYLAGEALGGHGQAGATAGLLFRPGFRAIVRGATSPAFTAPVARAGVDAARLISGATGEEAGRLVPLIEDNPRVRALIDAILRRPAPAVAQTD